MIKYTKEHVEWLKENGMNYYIKELTEQFNKTFNSNRSQASIKNVMLDKHIPRKIMTISEIAKAHTKYTETHMKWVKENIYKYSQKDLCKIFNETFNMNVSIGTFHNTLAKYGIKTRNTPSIKYTKEHIEWIINNYNKYITNHAFEINKFTNEFNKTFNINIKKKYLLCKLKNMGLQKPRASQVSLGNLRKMHGQWYIKINDIPNLTTNANYRKKANVMYEQYHNTKVNDLTETVIHLNNDINDFNKDNLYKLSLNTYRRYKTMFNSETLETKLNALKVCEIIQLIKEME